jgi:hypothetical protein
LLAKDGDFITRLYVQFPEFGFARELEEDSRSTSAAVLLGTFILARVIV